MPDDVYMHEPVGRFPDAMHFDGTPVHRHDDGMPEHEQWVLDYRRPDGVRHGPYLRYVASDLEKHVPHAQWSEIGFYKHGKRHGLLRRFAGHRVVVLEGVYVDDLPHGAFRWSRADGSLLDELSFEHGTGRWRAYTEQGARIEDGELLHGLREGRWLEWQPDGTVLEVKYRGGRRRSSRIDGDARTGTFETHDASGRVVHVYSLHDGFREGEETEWDEHGHVGSVFVWERGLCLEKQWPRLGERVRLNREGDVVCRWKYDVVVEGDRHATLDTPSRS